MASLPSRNISLPAESISSLCMALPDIKLNVSYNLAIL
jgi:hypothetical protein